MADRKTDERRHPAQNNGPLSIDMDKDMTVTIYFSGYESQEEPPATRRRSPWFILGDAVSSMLNVLCIGLAFATLFFIFLFLLFFMS